MLVVSLLSPGLRNPTAFIGGHSSWVGTGSDATTCGRESLLTNNTQERHSKRLARTCEGAAARKLRHVDPRPGHRPILVRSASVSPRRVVGPSLRWHGQQLPCPKSDASPFAPRHE